MLLCTLFNVTVSLETYRIARLRDTVCSVGIVSRTLPFTASNASIRYFRHTISLDEHRAKFQASHYLRQEKPQKGTKGEMPRSNERHPFYYRMLPHHRDRNESKMQYAKEYDLDDDGRPKFETDAKEVWFAGCHDGNFSLVSTKHAWSYIGLVDIGGGSVRNGTLNSLARIPLRWMIRQCLLAKTGIQFVPDSFKDVGLDPANFFPALTQQPQAPNSPASTAPDARASAHAAEPTDATLVDETEILLTAASTFNSEEDEESVDARQPMHDQLKLFGPW